MCATCQRHISQLVGANDGPEHRMNFSVYLDGIPQLSTSGSRRCDMLITDPEVRDAMMDCTGCKSFGLDGFLRALLLYAKLVW